ncbi:MAG TPA: nucleotidyltransferase domain-containing protein [Gaiellaceae bacterium]|jgi:predicted nucleotidyltransferase|nr:nucleotidyltransferase domain-containing protein [Gaiellaceae bacterium]
MSQLRTLATDLQTTDRTLRRALRDGTLRASRPSARSLHLPATERVYLRHAWPLLAALREALRTEPAVRLAVLFGSRARGDDRPDSDVDLMVALRRESEPSALASRLTDRTGLRIHVVRLDDAERTPILLAEVVREGRVLVDRESIWPALIERAPTIARAATRANRRIEREFDEAFPP